MSGCEWGGCRVTTRSPHIVVLRCKVHQGMKECVPRREVGCPLDRNRDLWWMRNRGRSSKVLCGRSLAFDSKGKTKKATTEAKLGQNRQSKESSRPFPSTQTHWD